jgi:hypothetical protein
MQKSKVFLSTVVMSLITLILLLASFQIVATPASADDGNPYKVKNIHGPDGKDIDEVVCPLKPPAKPEPAVKLPPGPSGSGINYVYGTGTSSVPAFRWSYGCSATSAAMLFGYYDQVNYPNFYRGGVCPLTSVWGTNTYYPSGTTCYECPLSATHSGVADRNIPGHVDDYWIDYNNPGPDPYSGTPHSSDSVADFMGTNQAAWHNTDGSTTFYFNTRGSPLYDFTDYESSGYRDGAHGMKLFATYGGYSVAAVFSQYIKGYHGIKNGFTFTNYVSEIDAGRPVLIQVNGHTMIGFGYNKTGSLVYLHDTWDASDHSMTWGGKYAGLQHYGVTVLRLQ